MIPRLYHVVAVNEKTGRRERLTAYPMHHDHACENKSRFSDHPARRIELEEAPNPAGRPWASATAAHLTECPEGDAVIRLHWEDGACLWQSYETHADARQWLAANGFSDYWGPKP